MEIAFALKASEMKLNRYATLEYVYILYRLRAYEKEKERDSDIIISHVHM